LTPIFLATYLDSSHLQFSTKKTTGEGHLDFKELSSRLRPYWETILTDICPGGKRVGSEYVAGTIYGGPGDSFKFNLNKGVYKDFASNDSGGDILHIYATVKGIPQSEAAKRLEESYLGNHAIPTHTQPLPRPKGEPVALPPDTDLPPFISGHNAPTFTDVCYSPKGHILTVECRYDNADGTKYYVCHTPYRYANGQIRWERKALPSPRPLFGLNELAKFPNAKIIIPEGGKSRRALRNILKRENLYGKLLPMSWSHGAQSVFKNNYDCLKGKHVIMWPDHDNAGYEAMQALKTILSPIVASLKILTPERDRPDGWDAADALQDPEFSFREWAPKHVTIIQEEARTKVPEVVSDQCIEVRQSDADAIGQYNLSPEAWALLNVTSKRGIAGTTNNISILMKESGLIKDEFWYDSFAQTEMMKPKDPEKNPAGEVMTHGALVRLRIALQRKYSSFAMLFERDQSFENGFALTCEDFEQNYAMKFISRLKWDGTPRLDTFLIEASKTVIKGRTRKIEDNEYNRFVSRYLMMAPLWRVLHPGKPMQMMPILEGPQGTRKTTFAEALAIPGTFRSLQINPSDKDTKIALLGCSIIEWGELTDMSKHQSNIIKNFITQPVDVVRRPYGKATLTLKRTAVLIGTTNDDAYLKDQTGNRRYLPVHVPGVLDVDYLMKWREQIWAEAWHRIGLGEEVWDAPQEMAEIEQNKRVPENSVLEVVQEYFAVEKMSGSFRLCDFREWLNEKKPALFRSLKGNIDHTIASALRKYGLESKNRRVGGLQAMWWSLPSDDDADGVSSEGDNMKLVRNEADGTMVLRPRLH
jgi:predicted P-loop ATPase